MAEIGKRAENRAKEYGDDRYDRVDTAPDRGQIVGRRYVALIKG